MIYYPRESVDINLEREVPFLIFIELRCDIYYDMR